MKETLRIILDTPRNIAQFWPRRREPENTPIPDLNGFEDEFKLLIDKFLEETGNTPPSHSN